MRPEPETIEVYHGRPAGSGTEFGDRYAMFTPSEAYATDRAGQGGTVIPAKITVKNPADLKSMHLSPSDPNFDKIVKRLQREGYDSAFYGDRNSKGRDTAWIVFDPKQINRR